MGLESNLISLEGELDVPEAYREYFDILLMGFHLSARPTTLSECWMFQIANPRAEQRYSERYRQKATEAYLRAIEKTGLISLSIPACIGRWNIKRLQRLARHTG